MRRPSSSHAQFFSSLKNLEKRLRLEEGQRHSPSSPPAQPSEHRGSINSQQTDSLGTPLYLNYNDHSDAVSTNPSSSNLQESEVPLHFLSNSPDFSQTQHSSLHANQSETRETDNISQRLNLDDDDDDDGNDIEQLMQLLGLSDSEEIEKSDFGCDDGFYERIVGVKGIKSGKEAARLESWIKHFSNGEKKEPFALAHLLLGKAAFVHSGDGDDYCGLKFPSTVDEFLQNDPPVD